MLEKGDSGSWVIASEGEEVIGHVVAFSQHDCFVLPMKDLLVNIQNEVSPRRSARLASPVALLSTVAHWHFFHTPKQNLLMAVEYGMKAASKKAVATALTIAHPDEISWLTVFHDLPDHLRVVLAALICIQGCRIHQAFVRPEHWLMNNAHNIALIWSASPIENRPSADEFRANTRDLLYTLRHAVLGGPVASSTSPTSRPAIGPKISISRQNSGCSARSPACVIRPESHVAADDPGKPEDNRPRLEDANLVTWAGQNDPSNPRHWRRARKSLYLLLLTMMMVTDNFAFLCIAPGVSTLVQDLTGHDSKLTGFVTSVYLLGGLSSRLLYEPLCSRYGRLPIYYACAIIFVAMAIASAKAQSLEQVIVFRFLAGNLRISSYVADEMAQDMIVGTKSTFIWRIVTIGISTSWIIGPLVGGYVCEYFGWRWVCLSHKLFSSHVKLT